MPRTQSFKIPAGARMTIASQANSTPLTFDGELLQFLPHMHLRGKSFRYEAKYPDGKERGPARRAALRFRLAVDVRSGEHEALPKGTLIHCTGTSIIRRAT